MKKIKIIVCIILFLLLTSGFVVANSLYREIRVLFDYINLEVNGKKVDESNILYDGTTYVPLRKVAEMLNGEVSWDEETRTASINTSTSDDTNEEQPQNPEIPEKYDLREFGRVTEIKDQGSTNSCWAFATISALETYQGNELGLVMDPFHLYYNTGYDDIDGIGQYVTAVPYFAAWKGPLINNSSNNVPVKKIQEVLYLEPGEVTTIKEMIMKYGAVASTIGMSNDSKYWNPETNAQYKYDSDYVNHAITLVGWDDNFSKNNFSTEPPMDGAFIVKNSWGEQWGDNGYFYVSYYDKSLGYGNNGRITNIVFSKVENNDYFSNNYQYDELGNTATWGSNETETFANVFEINKGNEEKLNAVSFYALGKNTSYELYIVENFESIDSFDEIKKLKEGSFEYAGYYTVEFDEEINLEQNQKIAIVVKITTPNNNKPVAIETPRGFNSSSAKSNFGQSYVKSNGEWVDFYSIERNGNVCLKAFTTNGYELPLEDLEISHETMDITVGEKAQLSSIFTPLNATNKNIYWSSDYENIVSIDKNGVIKGLKEGEADVVLKTLDGRFERKCRVVVSQVKSDDLLIADHDLEDIIRAKINKLDGKLTKDDLEKIQFLYIPSTNIVSLEGIHNLTNLREIQMKGNKVSDISPLSNITGIETILIYNNPIRDISSLKKLVNLKHLTIENGQVSNIDSVSELKELEHLCFYGNKIIDIEAVAGLRKLKLLDFVGNQITDIKALENLTNLENLYISANQIQDIESLRNLVNLEHLILGNNPITDLSPVDAFYDNLTNKDFEL